MKKIDKRFIFTAGNLKEGNNKIEIEFSPEDVLSYYGEEKGDLKNTKNKKMLIYLACFLGFGPKINLNLNLFKTGDKVIAEGNMIYTISLICALCSKEFTLNLNEKIYCVYLKEFKREYFASEREINKEEAFQEYYTTQINILPLIYDTLILSIPIAPHCPECQKNF
ncbi:MAG: DUF177 domain-containing protein [candidate division WOR-3 bacterium]|nr:DUF177 domain-containing protein [candidate division WOR-3 bacterium]MCX7837199.1 DUF177 domain-containing protein [candidate division WOR-3 bacterium]MDW8113965.1 DUF177 domain-containing protein [candidate division WOR-3 bacterium]